MKKFISPFFIFIFLSFFSLNFAPEFNSFYLYEFKINLHFYRVYSGEKSAQFLTKKGYLEIQKVAYSTLYYAMVGY